MLILKSKSSLKKFVAKKEIGFVPTMGGLHEGHISLIKRSLKDNPYTVVSIFVNPKQFGPNEDYQSYPRNFERDREILEKLKVSAVFFPSVKEIYGPDKEDFHTYLGYQKLESLYCGKYRPGFFNGIMLVVLKLLHLIEPKKIYFGKKDYQQYFIIKKMVANLNLDIKVYGLATVRDKSGLAYSSRNQHLTSNDMLVAEIIYRVLLRAKKLVRDGGVSSPATLKQKIIGWFGKEHRFRIQYVEIVDKSTLLPSTQLKNGVILIAGFINQIRLIDNIEI